MMAGQVLRTWEIIINVLFGTLAVPWPVNE